MTEARVEPTAPDTPHVVTRASWWLLAVLTAMYLVHGLDRMIVAILMEPIKAEFQLTDGQTGFIASMAYSMALAVCGIPLGLLVDRVTRKTFLAILVTIWSGAASLGGLATNFLTLSLARMAVGGAESGGAPVAVSMIGDCFPPQKRATAIGIFYLAAPVGAGLAFWVGGMIAAAYGWRMAFFLSGVPGLIVAAALLFTVREPIRGAVDKVVASVAPPLSETLRSIVKTPALLFLMMGLALSSLVQSSYLSWQASFFIREFGVNVGIAGTVVAIEAGLFGALGSGLGGIIGDRFAKGSQKRMIAFVSALTLIGTAAGVAGFLAPSFIVSCGLFMLYGFLINAYFGPGFSLVVNLSGVRQRGTVFSIFYVSNNLIGFGVGPFLTGGLSDLYGGATGLKFALVTIGGLSLVASSLYFLAARRIPATATLQRGTTPGH